MKKHLIKSLIILFILVSSMLTLAQPEGTRIDGVAGIVGKNIVLISEIEAQHLQSVMQGEKPGDALKCEILEELLLQRLLLNQAQFDSLVVSAGEVETEMERRLRYFIAQIGSVQALEEYYNKSVLEIKDEFRDIIKEQLLVQKMQQQITSDIRITPSEIRKYFRSLTDEEIPDIELQFKLAHLVILPEITEEEKLLLRAKMTDYRDRVLKGDDFGTLAVMYSEDPGSAKKRGELGFFGRGEMFPEFEAAAFKLQTPGEISPIVETKVGLHILQLIERRGELVNVRHILLMYQPGAQNVLNARNKIDSIHALISGGTISFEEAVEMYSQSKSKKNDGLMINPYTLDNTFYASHLDASVLFALEKTEAGNITTVISYRDDDNQSGYRIIRILEKIPAHKANLDDDYPFLQEMALEYKKREELNKWIVRKKSQTYIKIFEPYNNCDFEFDW
jgi:peptidyl-prolyl cis-trans isomerase SurA